MTPEIPGARIVFDEDAVQRVTEDIRRVLQCRQFLFGPLMQQVEDKFAELCKTEYALALSSGSSALEAILRALDVGGSEVIVPANTFFATAGAVVRAGGRPVIVDVGADMMIDVDAVRAELTPNTVAVVCVHIGGMLSTSLESLQEVCDKAGVALVEDAAHAFGSERAGKPIGSWGVAAAISLYPTKVVTAGEGGIVLTKDPEVARRVSVLRDQGKADSSANLHTEMGSSWRLSDVHCAVVLGHMSSHPQTMERRRAVSKRIESRLNSGWLRSVKEPQSDRWNRHRFVALASDGVTRAELELHFRRLGVGLARPVFERPLSQQPALEGHARVTPTPNADRLCQSHICLPVLGDMTDEEVDVVENALDSLPKLA